MRLISVSRPCICAALTALMFGAMPPATAGFIDGNTLLEYCGTSLSSARAYVMGVVDHEVTFGAVTGLDDQSHWKKQFICIPQGVKVDQVKDATCAYLIDNPQNRHWNASVLVYNAVRESFPCP